MWNWVVYIVCRTGDLWISAFFSLLCYSSTRENFIKSSWKNSCIQQLVIIIPTKHSKFFLGVFNAYSDAPQKICRKKMKIVHMAAISRWMRDKSLQIFLNRCHLFTNFLPKNPVSILEDREKCDGKEKLTWLSWRGKNKWKWHERSFMELMVNIFLG